MSGQINFTNLRIFQHIEASHGDALKVLNDGREKRVASVYELGNQNNSLETTAHGAVAFAYKLSDSLAEKKEEDAFFFTNFRSTIRRIRRLLS